MFINKLKTKFNRFFYSMVFYYKKNSQLLLKKFCHKSWTNAFVWSLRSKIVIVGPVNELKIIMFELNYVTVLVYAKTIATTSVLVNNCYLSETYVASCSRTARHNWTHHIRLTHENSCDNYAAPRNCLPCV